MTELQRTINGPFLVDESKLSRLVQVATASLDTETVQASYTVNAGPTSLWNLASLDAVLGMDNTRTKPVRRLEINLVDSKRQRVKVEMGDGKTPYINLSVLSEDHKSAMDTFAKVEEQVERLAVTGFDRLATNVFPSITVIGGIVFAFVLVALPGGRHAADDKTLLNPSDIAELTKRFSAPNAGVPELLEFHRRQLKNMITPAASIPYSTGTWVAWGVAFFLYVVFCLAVSSHRRSVFLWGDQVERHAALVKRRDYLWRTVFAGTVLGIATKVALSYLGR